MKVYRHHTTRETQAELAARKAEAERVGRIQHPEAARVEVHAYYGGQFYVAVFEREDDRSGYVVPVGA